MFGLQQSYTSSRNNRFTTTVKLMKRNAHELFVKAKKDGDCSNLEPKSGYVGKVGENSAASSNVSEEVVETSAWSEDVADLETKRGDKGVSSNLRGNLGKRGMRMTEKLGKLCPVELEVADVSYQHVGHVGVRGNDDDETHFNVKIVSKEFEGKSLTQRHRLVYGLLQDDFQSGLHALSIVAKTPSEVDKR